MTNVETKTPGRPPAVISWPDGVFTVAQLRKATNLSKVTIYQKIEDAINLGQIAKIGKEPGGKGRPRDLYQKRPFKSVAEVLQNSEVTPVEIVAPVAAV